MYRGSEQAVHGDDEFARLHSRGVRGFVSIASPLAFLRVGHAFQRLVARSPPAACAFLFRDEDHVQSDVLVQGDVDDGRDDTDDPV